MAYPTPNGRKGTAARSSEKGNEAILTDFLTNDGRWGVFSSRDWSAKQRETQECVTMFEGKKGDYSQSKDKSIFIPAFISRSCDQVGGCMAPGSRTADEVSPIHFFGVYDGHGGSQIPALVFSAIKLAEDSLADICRHAMA
ncbi:hypothetical protein V6N12_055564 [Hibiscus sabdariffa]|uniref:Protein-serine/threonine phosphatase n=1 Tax=Hibiscus sabdariffa TaxID=183260 RepID=A0ABR2BVU0_9ROSI